mmetsp:Transcript_3754/g.13344  ORF Transcript_3754/g.13344 Transcript_3754/m.13344 type:complete len:218 (+) Transcript_3754:596-1249(+)
MCSPSFDASKILISESMPEAARTGKWGCGITLLTTCESPGSLHTSSVVFLFHTKMLPQSPPVVTYSSPHMNATPLRNVRVFFRPSYFFAHPSYRFSNSSIESCLKRSILTDETTLRVSKTYTSSPLYVHANSPVLLNAIPEIPSNRRDRNEDLMSSSSPWNFFIAPNANPGQYSATVGKHLSTNPDDREGGDDGNPKPPAAPVGVPGLPTVLLGETP